MVTAVLNVKIDDALKERLRHYAEVNNENLSVTTEKLLLLMIKPLWLALNKNVPAVKRSVI